VLLIVVFISYGDLLGKRVKGRSLQLWSGISGLGLVLVFGGCEKIVDWRLFMARNLRLYLLFVCGLDVLRNRSVGGLVALGWPRRFSPVDLLLPACSGEDGRRRSAMYAGLFTRR
jgi:hypothetical protein